VELFFLDGGSTSTGGSGILAPLVIKLCRNYGDMSQISGNGRNHSRIGLRFRICILGYCSTGDWRPETIYR
jgi:hypothetical protein